MIKNIIKIKNPTVVGLNPDLRKIPNCYKANYKKSDNPFEEVADAIFSYNKDIIDTIASLIPAVKPQIAFYENTVRSAFLGSESLAPFTDTCAEDILPCFNEDGLGAIVNSSRGILYTHMSDSERETCTREEYL